MASLLMFKAPLFPFDPSIDGPMGHLHLILIYTITWGLHLAYVAFIAYKWRAVVKERAAEAGR
jgi:hypothetical protein